MSARIKDEDLEDRQMAFLALLEVYRGNTSETCRAMTLGYHTYLKWFRADEGFREKLSHVREGLVDHVESKLMDNIDGRSNKAIIFWLSRQARHRGYGDSISLTGADGGPIQIGAQLGVDYPPEPKTIEDWERQVESARAARKAVEARVQAEEATEADLEAMDEVERTPEPVLLLDAGSETAESES